MRVIQHAADDKGNLVPFYREPDEPALSGEELYRRNLEGRKAPPWLVEQRLDAFRRR